MYRRRSKSSTATRRLLTRETQHCIQWVRDMAAVSLTAEALARIVSVAEDALRARYKQRDARAAELFGRAAECAVAAGVPPDSLILASLRTLRGYALRGLSRETGVPETSAVAMRAEAWATTREVMRTLSARVQAGTLLPGNIRADELAYAEAILYAELRIASPERLHDADYMARCTVKAPLFGYDLVLVGALRALIDLWKTDDASRLDAADTEAAQTFVLRVLALMTEVQQDSRILVPDSEATLFSSLMCLIKPEIRAVARGQCLQPQFYDTLVATCNAPALQAALSERGTLEFIHQSDFIATGMAEERARQAADVAAYGLRTCALPACGAREFSVHQFKRCGGCKAVVYCSAECAKAHWKAGHKRECSRAATPAQPNK